jgi:hypothetical protein
MTSHRSRLRPSVRICVAVPLLLVGCLLAACDDDKPGARATATGTPAGGAAVIATEQSLPSQGNDHLADASAPHPPYNSNPPTSGWHLPALPRPGVYTQAPRPEGLPHFMEHGGLWLLYNCPGGCESDVRELNAIVNGAIDKGRPVALAPYPDMGARFAVVGWQRLLSLDGLNRARIEEFIGRYACDYNPEGGPYCRERRGEPGPTTGTPTPFVSPRP